jgi:hypothetical protein
MIHWKAAGALILSVSLSGCSDDARRPASENPNERTRDLESWSFEEEQRIGSLDGEGPYVFGRIEAIEIDANGDILVFDGLANELRRFSAAGEHLRTMGRGGSGPGEFRSVLGMDLGPDGELWIVDGRNARYTVLDAEKSLQSVPRVARVVRRPWVGGFDEEGQFYDLATESEGQTITDLMLRTSAAGGITDTFQIPRLEEPTVQLGGGGVTMAAPFAPRVLRAWDPRGSVWQAVSSEYRIANVRLNGDTAVVVSRHLEPMPLTPEQRDSVAAFVRHIELTYGRNVEPEMRPTTASPLRWFTLDDEHNLWVCATALRPCTEFDVFDPTGSFIGTATLPEPISDLPLPVIRDDRIYAVVEGELGEPQVVVGRIVR